MKYEVSRKRVAALAEQKEDENWNFRCFLKGCDVGACRTYQHSDFNLSFSD